MKLCRFNVGLRVFVATSIESSLSFSFSFFLYHHAITFSLIKRNDYPAIIKKLITMRRPIMNIMELPRPSSKSTSLPIRGINTKKYAVIYRQSSLKYSSLRDRGLSWGSESPINCRWSTLRKRSNWISKPGRVPSEKIRSAKIRRRTRNSLM